MQTQIYKIGLAIIRNDCLLLCKPFAFEALIVPGGIKEGDETVVENLTREVKEELGDDAMLDPQSLHFVGNFVDRAAGKTDRIVEIELYTGQVRGRLTASSEISELVWFNPLEPKGHKLSAVV
jgi:8-oxo-dGTP diphosphatase